MKLISTHAQPYMIAILIAVFFSLGMTVSAQDAVPSEATTPPMKETPRAALEKNIQDRIVNLASNVENRLSAAVRRMENIVGRLETRIVKMKATAVDTTSAEASLQKAKNAIAAAKNTIDELGSVEAAMSSDSPQEAFQSIRLQFMASGNLIRQTQVELRETVRLLKEAARTATPNQGASSAVSNTAE